MVGTPCGMEMKFERSILATRPTILMGFLQKRNALGFRKTFEKFILKGELQSVRIIQNENTTNICSCLCKSNFFLKNNMH